MEILNNYIQGTWKSSVADETFPILNPATQEKLGQVPLKKGTGKDVEFAVEAAKKVFPEWSQTPIGQRVQPLFKLKFLLEENFEELAHTITLECGKTLAESRGEIQRAIENIEVACGSPMLTQSEFLENVAPGIDEFVIRQPIGICACITPFNFPGMIPFWFLPYAIACGNPFIVKPSERVPLTMNKVFQLIDQLDLPPGVISLVHGGKETVDALLEHPDVKAVSFVGSTPTAKYIYAKGASEGKRVQAQGGAKNPIVILPDADLEKTAQIVTDSVYGCAGQRCLAASVVLTVGDQDGIIKDALYQSASSRVTGYGLNEGVEMGPVITAQSKERIEGWIQKGEKEGADLILDGRGAKIKDYEKGNFVKPTILENVPLEGEVIKSEIFGPVMSLIHLKSVDEAIQFVNKNAYGNMACLFTSNGAQARKFRSLAQAGNIGINIGVAAPLAQFPFSGWKDSFFGDLHAQGHHAIEFYTQTKVVIERWPKEWSRKF